MDAELLSGESPSQQQTTHSQEQVEQAAQEAVVQQLSEQEQERLFVSNPDNQRNAISLAQQIEACVGKNWFTVTRFASKAGLDRQIATMKLQMCKMFGLAEVKMGDFTDGRKNLRVPMFKITLSKEARVKAIEQVIEYHQNQILALQSQIKVFQS